MSSLGDFQACTTFSIIHHYSKSTLQYCRCITVILLWESCCFEMPIKQVSRPRSLQMVNKLHITQDYSVSYSRATSLKQSWKLSILFPGTQPCWRNQKQALTLSRCLRVVSFGHKKPWYISSIYRVLFFKIFLLQQSTDVLMACTYQRHGRNVLFVHCLQNISEGHAVMLAKFWSINLKW